MLTIFAVSRYHFRVAVLIFKFAHYHPARDQINIGNFTAGFKFYFKKLSCGYDDRTGTQNNL